MALTTKRIIALPSQTDPQEGDYLAIDNEQGGTHKIPVGRVGVEVDDTLTEQGKAADAKAVGDALGEIRSQVEATDDAIDEIRSQIEVTGTASGAIATFTDGADMPAKSVIVNIEPQQSGTGTPSPENVRPISGWESVSVDVCGKNLFNKANAIELYCDGSTKLAPNATFKSVYIPLQPNASYVYTQTVFGNYTRLALCNSLEAQTSIYKPTTKTLGYVETTPLAFTNTDFKYLVCTIYRSTTDTNTFDEIADSCMLELGTTATAYEPYTGTTKTVNLGRTVYGGTVDVVRGTLTVTHAIVDLGTLDWDKFTVGNNYIFATTGLNGANKANKGGVITMICDRYLGVGNVTSNVDAYARGNGTCCALTGGDKRVYVRDDSYSDATAFKAAMQGVQLCYELATPQTYQLTPTEIQTLLGENNVWADSGDVEVVYIRDLNIAINNLLNSNGTRSLGMMAMSAPTEATAEEPTDEQTEEPAEDDMR